VKDDVKILVHRTSMVTGGIGVVLSPIPLVDEIVLFPVYAVFSSRIAKRHGLKWGQVPWRPILKSTAAGLVARAAVNLTVALVPGVSAVGTAATAVALTEILGEYVDQTCQAPEAAKPLTVKGVVEMLKKVVVSKAKKGAKAQPSAA
jgi:uncharacterized protein (DUF697 family)